MANESNYWSRYFRQRMGRRRALGVGGTITAGAAGLALVGCGDDDDDDDDGGDDPTASGGDDPSTGAGDAVSGGTLVSAYTSPEGPLSWDPHTQADGYTQGAMDLIFSKLFRYVPTTSPIDRELVGDVVDSWEQPDDLTTTLTLKEGVTWHDLAPVDGRAFTAEDAAYSFKRLMTDDPTFVLRGYADVISDVSAVDDRTVTFTTNFPYAPILHNFTTTNAKLLAMESVEDGDPINNPIGTGPFMLDDYRRSAEIKYIKHPNFFKAGTPYLDAYTSPIMPDPSSVIAAFRGGQVDFANPATPQDRDNLQDSNPDAQIYKFPTVAGPVMRFNCADPNFANPLVRQAIALGTNWEEYMDIMIGGDGVRHSPMPQAIAFWALPENELPQFNLEEAKAMLEAAGVGDGFSVKSTATEPYQAIDLTEITVSQMGALGIDVEIDVLDNNAWLEQSYFATNFSFSTYADFAYSDPDRGLFDHYHTTGVSNNHNLSDPDLDALLEQQRQALDVDERQQIVLEAQRLLLELAPRVWLYEGFGYNAVAARVQNYNPVIDAKLAIEDVWIKA